MRGKLLNIPELERFTFETHFLSSVHSQLTYEKLDSALILDNSESLASKLEGLVNHQPRKIAHQSVALKQEGLDSTPEISHTEQEIQGLQFSGSSPNCSLEIKIDSLVYSEYKYTGFRDFNERLQRIAQAVQDNLGVDTIRSVSLRKINSLSVSSVSSLPEAFSVFNEAFFGPLRSGIADVDSVRMFEGSLMLEKNGYFCVIRDRVRPTGEGKLEVQLDFDLIDKNAKYIEPTFQECLENLNNTSFDLFMWSVNDELTDIMRNQRNML